MDNGDEEDEYDSEMEDFIDDDPLLDDELQRQDFEETLKWEIFKNFVCMDNFWKILPVFQVDQSPVQ